MLANYNKREFPYFDKEYLSEHTANITLITTKDRNDTHHRYFQSTLQQKVLATQRDHQRQARTGTHSEFFKSYGNSSAVHS